MKLRRAREHVHAKFPTADEGHRVAADGDLRTLELGQGSAAPKLFACGRSACPARWPARDSRAAAASTLPTGYVAVPRNADDDGPAVVDHFDQ